MGFNLYKSTSNPPEETSNPTPPPSSASPPRNAPRTRLSPRTQAPRQGVRRSRRAQRSLLNRANYNLPSEFLSSSYRPINSSSPSQLKGQQITLIITPNTTSNRRKGAYTMSITGYNSKMSFSIPPSFLINIPTAPRPRNSPFAASDPPVEDPGFASDNESTTSEDSILSDPEWINSNRELAMELLLGSSEDEFLGSLLGREHFEEFEERMGGGDTDNGLYEDDDLEMDFEMTEADEEDVGMDTEQDNSSSGARHALREVDEDYD
ncbi:hypothetical protein DFH27DRAFT_606166 [Peziza echinospora]|nr:hypothetical protein DFH27DRAFT_606166 [Peziza echinospora]